MINAAHTAAILLAAGQSVRFGGNDKLLADLDGKPLALHAAHRLVDLAPGSLIAVCRDADSALARDLVALGFVIVANPDSARGLSHSLACGIAQAARGSALAALICLADMPFVSTAHIQTLLDRFEENTSPVVASSDGHAAMPPAIFARSLFDRLQSTSGDRGGRGLLAGALLVPASPDELADIDQPQDLRGV